MNTNVRVVALLTVVAASCLGAVAEGPRVSTVSVVGTAVTRVAPDLVAWQIGISEFDQTPLPAKERCDAKVKAVLALASELGVAPEDVQTGSLNIRREYNHDEQGRQTTFKHFAVNQPITIRQRDLTRFDEFISRLMTMGDMEVSFSPESSRALELRKDTRVKAVRAAREKVDIMCREAGGKAGRPLRIEEYKENDFGQAAYMSNANVLVAAGEQMPDLSEGTFAPGAIEIRVTVYVDFAIE